MFDGGYSYPYTPSEIYDPTPQPVQVQQVWQPSYTPVSLPEWDLLCDFCGDEITEGEEAVELLIGVAGRGPKSGRAMVVESKLIDYSLASLHPWCVGDFALEAIYSEECEAEPIFCEKCGTEVDGDSED